MPPINLLPNISSSTVNTYPPTAVLSLPRHDSPQLIPPQKPRFRAQKFRFGVMMTPPQSSVNQPSTDSLVDSRSVLGARCHAFPPCSACLAARLPVEQRAVPAQPR
jgi:hypothetical protein